MKLIQISFALLLSSLAVFAQRTVSVHDFNYTFYGDKSMSINTAEALAVQEAIDAAIAKEFGVTVQGQEISITDIHNNKDNSSFAHMGMTSRRGIWLGHTQKPKFGDCYMKDNMLVVPVTINGEIREIKRAQTDFDAHVLREHADDGSESYTFRHGDKCFVTFQSAVKGYVAIYLLGENSVECLLPYVWSDESRRFVEKDRRYVFFGEDDSHELRLGCTNNSIQEANVMYVIFSPHPFDKCIDSEGTNAQDAFPDEIEGKRYSAAPRSVKIDKFNKWLLKLQREDKDLVYKSSIILINKGK